MGQCFPWPGSVSGVLGTPCWSSGTVCRAPSDQLGLPFPGAAQPWHTISRALFASTSQFLLLPLYCPPHLGQLKVRLGGLL